MCNVCYSPVSILFSSIVVKMYDTMTTEQLRLTKCQLHIKQYITTYESKAVLSGLSLNKATHDKQDFCASDWNIVVFGRIIRVLEPCKLGKHIRPKDYSHSYMKQRLQKILAHTIIPRPVYNFWTEVHKIAMVWLKQRSYSEHRAVNEAILMTLGM